jgi:hypothetical protein
VASTPNIQDLENFLPDSQVEDPFYLAVHGCPNSGGVHHILQVSPGETCPKTKTVKDRAITSVVDPDPDLVDP